MKFNERLNPFKYGFFTKKADDFYYILFIHISNSECLARYAIFQTIPDYINPNFDMPEVSNFKHNSETGDFTSNIGNGKFVFIENDRFKVIFNNFKYNNTPNLELEFNEKLNYNMGENQHKNVKI